jgi:hypothetical protein
LEAVYDDEEDYEEEEDEGEEEETDEEEEWWILRSKTIKLVKAKANLPGSKGSAHKKLADKYSNRKANLPASKRSTR